MTDIKISDVVLSASEQTIIRQIAAHWSEELQMVDWREPKFEVPSMLYHKLEKLGTGKVDPNRNHILVFDNEIRELVERFDYAKRDELNADQWAKAAKWIRSKKWSFPIMLAVVGLPLVVDYLKMFLWLVSYFLTGKTPD